MARETNLTPELAARIVEAIADGNHKACAAEVNGVAESTLYEWIQRGRGLHPDREAQPIFAEFAEAIARAESQAEKHAVKALKNAFASEKDGWRAAEVWLKRARPRRWDPKPIEETVISEASRSPEDRVAMLARLESLAAALRSGGDES